MHATEVTIRARFTVRELAHSLQAAAGYPYMGYGSFNHIWSPITRHARWSCWANCD